MTITPKMGAGGSPPRHLCRERRENGVPGRGNGRGKRWSKQTSQGRREGSRPCILPVTLRDSAEK